MHHYLHNSKIHNIFAETFRDMDYKEMIKQIEPKYRALVEMCFDTISEYRNESLGDATINELERCLKEVLSNDK